jgi:hypothetical protein
MDKVTMLLLLICLSACSFGRNERDSDTSELDKIYIGQYHGSPIFFADESQTLVTIENNSIKHFKSISKEQSPLFICDRYTFYKRTAKNKQKSALLVVDNSTNEVVLDLNTEKEILSLVASQDGEVVFFSDGFSATIKRLNVSARSFSSLPVAGEVKFLTNSALYFFKYPGNETIEPVVDLMACDFKNNFSTKKILSDVFDGSLIIVSDTDEYVLCEAKYKEQFKEMVVKLSGTTTKALSDVNFVDYCGGYYVKDENCFKLFMNSSPKSRCIVAQ